MPQPLLSVIVPCYNTEKYVDKCIASIVGQTYSNLEILLIDDGSADSTGNICDEWQAKDSRIRVIHKQNEGPAYVRRTGIEKATADYVTFVDSDDWIDEHMYADMMSALLSTNSDIAQCDLCFVQEDGSVEYRKEQPTKTSIVIDRVESVLMFLRDYKWHISYCTKIFKKALFEDIAFPKGRHGGEEAVVMQSVFHKSSHIVFLEYPYYKYYQRGNSFSKTGNIEKEIKKYCDYSDADYDHYAFVKKYPEYHSALPLKKIMAAESGIRILNYMILYPKHCKKEYYQTKVEQMCAMSFSSNEKLPRRIKISLFLLKISPILFKLMRKFWIRMLMITNRLKITNNHNYKLEYI